MELHIVSLLIKDLLSKIYSLSTVNSQVKLMALPFRVYSRSKREMNKSAWTLKNIGSQP